MWYAKHEATGDGSKRGEKKKQNKIQLHPATDLSLGSMELVFIFSMYLPVRTI
jgi:hypothetical protein